MSKKTCQNPLFWGAKLKDIIFTPGVLLGRLLDSETGLPEAGVQVLLKQADGVVLTTRTDENGYYLFDVPRGGEYEISIILIDDEGEEVEVAMPASVADSDVGRGETTIGPSLVAGVIRDRDTGQPLASVLVELINEAGMVVDSVHTDQRGRYSFLVDVGTSIDAQSLQALNLGGYQMRARTEDGRESRLAVPVMEPGDVLVNLNLSMEARGSVYNAVTDERIPGAKVTVLYAEGPREGSPAELPLVGGTPQANPQFTDAQGRYLFQVEPGQYRLQVEADQFLTHLSDPLDHTQLARLIGLYLATGVEDIELEKTAPASAAPGDTVPYTIELNHDGEHSIPELVVSDTLPGDLIYVEGSASHGGSYEDGVLTWILQDVEPGTVTLQYLTELYSEAIFGQALENTVEAVISHLEDGIETGHQLQVGQRQPEITIDLTANKDQMAVGEFIQYRLQAENKDDVPGAVAAEDAWIELRLPQGFVYEPGSADAAGVHSYEPEIDSGTLRFAHGRLEPGETAVIRLTAKAKTAASDSDGKAEAYADGVSETGYDFRVGPAEHRLVMQKGAFGVGSTIVGTVFIDQDGSGLQAAGEPGIAGVELYLDNGLRVVTDQYGRYSIGPILPGTRALTVKGATLPAGTKVQGEKEGNASLTVTVQPGSVAIADIPLREGDYDSGQAGALGAGTVELTLQARPLRLMGTGSGFLDYDEGSYRITARYDDRREYALDLTNERFPRSYSFGDQSRTDDKTPSSRPLYLRIQSEEAGLLYGHLDTRWKTSSRYSEYRSQVTGLYAEHEQGLEAYLFRSHWETHAETMAGRGVSGLYYLEYTDIQPGSEQVWLVTLDSDTDEEIERRLLRRDSDYRIDYQWGSLDFADPVPSMDRDLNTIVIAASYAVDGEAGREFGYGLRFTVWEDQPLHLTLIGGPAVLEDRPPLFGVDGTVDIAENFTLQYEAAAAFGEGGALWADAAWTPQSRLQLSASGEWVSGRFTAAGEEERREEGVQVDAAVEYELGDAWTAGYEAGYEKTGSEAAQTESQASLDYDPENWFSSSLEVSRDGSLFPIGRGASWSAGAAGNWDLGEQGALQLALRTPLSLDLKDVSLEADYAYAITESLSARATYKGDAARLTDGDGRWVFGFDAQPGETTNLYGRMEPNAGRTTAGMHQGMAISDELSGLLWLEGTMDRDHGLEYAGSLRLDYDGGEAFRPRARLEYSRRDSGSEGSVLLGAEGRIDRGFAYQLHSIWYRRSAAAERQRLQDEIRVELTYRHRAEQDHIVGVNYLRRSYEYPDGSEFTATGSTVQALVADWAYRLTDTISLGVQGGYRQVRERSRSDGAAGTLTSNLFLAQASAEYQLLEDLRLSLYGRRLWDSESVHTGAAVEVTKDLHQHIGLSLGYSSLSLEDPDLSSLVDWPQGIYLRLRGQFQICKSE